MSDPSDLFADELADAQRGVLAIHTHGGQKLSRAQRDFNQLIEEIRGLREELANWNRMDADAQARIAREVGPLYTAFARERRAAILTMGAILEGGLPGGAPRRAERNALVDHLLELFDAHADDSGADEELIALHDRHAPLSFEEDLEFDRQAMREMTEQALGVEIDDELSGEELMDAIEAAHAAAEEAERRRAEHREQARRASRNAKQGARIEAEATARAQAEEAMSKSVREVYRKLASALHPDRASDAADHERRHMAMQRVNDCYEKRDLLGLLTLQLEVEQIDAGALKQLSDKRLAHFNAVLREQRAELRAECNAIRERLAHAFGSAQRRLTPALLATEITRLAREARRDLRDIEDHHAMLRDPEARRRFLKAYARERRAEEREMVRHAADVAEFDAAFDEFFGGGFVPDPPARSRKRGKRGRG